MILSISWRNIWRNKVRSLIIIIAIALGLFSGVFSSAFSLGMIKQRTYNAVKTEISHIQVHAKDFIETNKNTKILENASFLKKTIEALPHVQSTSNRIITDAMVTSAETGSGVRVIGINPKDEINVTNLSEKIKEGNYLEGIKRNPILIGEKLAKKLKVGLRKKVRLTIQQFDGTLSYHSFRIAGVYKTVNTTYDEMNVFVKKADLEKALQIPKNTCHEIAIFLNDSESSDTTSAKIKEEFPKIDSRTWKELSPEMKLLQKSMDTMSYSFIAIILFALLFGIINTMLMAILERTKELGMLMAIGMNKTKIFTMIMVETVYLTIIGGLIGVLLGYSAVFFSEKQGLNLSALYKKGLEANGYDSIIFPSIEPKELIFISILVLLTGIIASIFPSIKALKLNTSEAIRTDI